MNQTDPSARTEPDATGDTARSVTRMGRASISKGASYLRNGVESGAVTATVGVVGILSGLRAVRAGERRSGLAKVALGVGCLTVALVQRRSRDRSGEADVEETDVGDTGPDADDAGGEQAHAASEVAAEISETPSDDVGDSPEPEPETETIERLGEAAFNEQSRKVPAPQQAFNRGFLAHSSMVCWGIRARDDAVLIAQDYDAIAGREGVKYVGSSEIGTDVREVPIPDVVLNHWDEVNRAGTAVTGGDDILFVTTDRLATDGLLRVLPSEWAEGLEE